MASGEVHARQPPAGIMQMLAGAVKPRLAQGRSRGALAELHGSHTDNNSIHLALFLCRAGLQSLMNLVCSQVKEVQIIFHRIAVPQTISQADDSYENQEAGVRTKLPRLG